MNFLNQQISKSLQLTNDELQKSCTKEDLLFFLDQYIQDLIDNDFEKLLQLLYRIDVSEVKVKEALCLSGPKKASYTIAKLIIEREEQKVNTRKKYS